MKIRSLNGAILGLLLPVGFCVLAAATSRRDPRPEDVTSINGIVAALYDTISGAKGQQRDWDRLRSLFAPGARMLVAVPADNGGAPGRLRPFELEDFIARGDASSKTDAFYESEVARKTDQFGCMANVWSTYESRIDPKAAPFSKGINSIELFHDGKRWWVVSIYWTSESPEQPIPEKYQNTKAAKE
jgi:hypothetical protein